MRAPRRRAAPGSGAGPPGAAAVGGHADAAARGSREPAPVRFPLGRRTPRRYCQAPKPVMGGSSLFAECDHDWVGWSGKLRCRKCGATQG